MGVELISQTEAAPAAYPTLPDGLSDAALLLDRAALWQRIEGYTAHRFSARAVEWIVRGPGEWLPPLVPATIATTEVWQDDEWQPIALRPLPLGGFILGCSGPYRLIGEVGAGPAPAAVKEAFRWLAEYWAASAGDQLPGVTAANISEGSLSISTRRAAAWQALAIHNSGAADLLRPYRRAPRA